VQPLAQVAEVLAVAARRGLASHLDGARLFDAAVASGESVGRRAAGFSTVSLCFSKGLGCPAGSVLCGSAPTMAAARRVRKRLGGGMRQSGMLAAAASYALDHHVARLAEDHALAREAAMGLMLDGFDVELPETNMVRVKVPQAAAFEARLQAAGVRCFAVGPEHLRLVFHLDVPRDAVTPLLRAFRAARA
jgi:threonine aldolase